MPHVGYTAFIVGLLLMMGITVMAATQVQRATQFPGYLVVAVCGTLPSGVTYPAGTYQAATQDVNGKHCVNQ